MSSKPILSIKWSVLIGTMIKFDSDGDGEGYDTCKRQWRIQDFPEGGAPTPKSAIILHIFCRKLHENERIWTPGGARVLAPPHYSGSANDY